MEHIGSEHLVYAFSPDNKPVTTVGLNEIFLVDCPDCYSGQIRSEQDLQPAIGTSLLSVTCDLCVFQIINEKMIIRTVVPKSIIAALPIRS